ncbi:biotin-dependent carboxyltransferase family protein [Dokdonella sp.]|uniref:5-oxoprolinase subunit C family protein n=1 Tax=Dokdonella sp. TaxID=2291710 RepID=UPI003529A0DC
MSIRVLAPGLSTSVQDAGRVGYRKLGVSQAGVMDPYSSSAANILLGNPEDSAVIEITLSGPQLVFDSAARIALCGASIDARVDTHVLPCWRRIELPAGSVLTLGPCRKGARAYLAVAGGIRVPPVLGSASTDLRSGFGGLHGRCLRAGDELQLLDKTAGVRQLHVDTRWVDPAEDLDLEGVARIRVLPGRDHLKNTDALHESDWQVDAASNRQGLRLSGTRLEIASERERISEPVMPGTVQLPPDGQPIILMADAQTHGGYPRIAHAIRADQPRLAQLRPGERFRLVACTPLEAQRALHEQRQRLARIRVAMEGIG